MSLTCQRETCAQIIEDIKPLIVRHWREIALHQDEVPLDPDYAKYKKLEAAGALCIVSCRRDAALVGYSIFFLNRHIHYKGCFMASNDVLFLDAPERKGTAGLKLIRESERILEGLGVKRVIWHIKPKHDFSPILRRFGYEQEEIIMGKLLGG